MADDSGRWTMRDDAPAEDEVRFMEEETGEPGLPNVFKRAVMVVVSPGQLFAALAAKPAAIGVMLLSAGIMTAVMAVAPASPVAELEGVGEGMQAIGKIGAVVSAAVGALIGPLVITVVTWLLFLVIRRDDATFKQHLAVNAHASFIGVAGFVATLPLWFATGDPTQTFSLGSLFAFMLDGGFAKRLLSMFGVTAS